MERGEDSVAGAPGRGLRWSALSVIALAVLAVDQALKESVRANLEPGEGTHLFGSYSIQHVQNFGIAGGGLEARALPLAVLAMMAVLGLYEFLAQRGHGRVSLVIGFGLLVGGGLGISSTAPGSASSPTSSARGRTRSTSRTSPSSRVAWSSSSGWRPRSSGCGRTETRATESSANEQGRIGRGQQDPDPGVATRHTVCHLECARDPVARHEPERSRCDCIATTGDDDAPEPRERRSRIPPSPRRGAVGGMRSLLGTPRAHARRMRQHVPRRPAPRRLGWCAGR